MCSKNVKTNTNIGSVTIATANSHLNGTGIMGTVLTAGTASGASGTFIRSITIKATGNTTLGMVRIFINDGSTNYLYREVMVPANNQTGVVQAFTATITEPFTLNSGYAIKAATQNAESFNVIANGMDMITCDC